VCRRHLHSFPFKGAHVACSRLLFQHINCGKFQFKFAFCLPWCRLTADTEPEKPKKARQPKPETPIPLDPRTRDFRRTHARTTIPNSQDRGPSPQDTPTFADPRRLAVALPGFLPSCHPSFLPGQLPCFVSCSFSFICIHMPRAKSRK